MSAKKIIDRYTMVEVRCAKGELISSWTDIHIAMNEAKAYANRTGRLVRVTEVEVTRTSRQLANYG